jgi:hypothetical protein
VEGQVESKGVESGYAMTVALLAARKVGWYSAPIGSAQLSGKVCDVLERSVRTWVEEYHFE